MNTKQIAICERREFYERFIDDDWMKEIEKRFAGKGQIAEYWNDLAYDLRSLDYMARMPHVFCTGVSSFIAGARSGKNDPIGPPIAEALVVKLKEEMPFFGHRPDDLRAIYKTFEKIELEIKNAKTESQSEIRDQIWGSMVSNSVMQMSIHGIMKMAYLGIFGSYENYVVRNVAYRLKEKVRVTHKDYIEKIVRSYSDDGCNVIWRNQQMKTHKEFRDLLTHASGIVPADRVDLIRNKDYMIMDKDRRVQIMPHNIIYLMRDICASITWISIHCDDAIST